MRITLLPCHSHCCRHHSSSGIEPLWIRATYRCTKWQLQEIEEEDEMDCLYDLLVVTSARRPAKQREPNRLSARGHCGGTTTWSLISYDGQMNEWLDTRAKKLPEQEFEPRVMIACTSFIGLARCACISRNCKMKTRNDAWVMAGTIVYEGLTISVKPKGIVVAKVMVVAPFVNFVLYMRRKRKTKLFQVSA